jgi:hypothetical protein
MKKETSMTFQPRTLADGSICCSSPTALCPDCERERTTDGYARALATYRTPEQRAAAERQAAQVAAIEESAASVADEVAATLRMIRGER